MTVCSRFHGYSSNSCQGISVWTHTASMASKKQMQNLVISLCPCLGATARNPDQQHFSTMYDQYILCNLKFAVFASDVLKECACWLLIWVLIRCSWLTQRSSCWKDTKQTLSALFANTQGDYREITGSKTSLSARAASKLSLHILLGMLWFI